MPAAVEDEIMTAARPDEVLAAGGQGVAMAAGGHAGGPDSQEGPDDDERELSQLFGKHAKETLRDAMGSVRYVSDFISEFRAKNQLLSPDVDPALSLLEMGNISRRQVHRSVISALRDDLLARIKVAGAARNNALLKELFDGIWEYITDEDLSPVVVAVMEAGDDSVVGADFWPWLDSHARQHNYEFPKLPTKLKARMWSHVPDAFDAEIYALLSNVSDFVPPSNMQDLFRGDYCNEVDRNQAHIEKLVTLVKAAKKEKINAVSRIISVCIVRSVMPEVSENTRVAIANLLLDFLNQPLFQTGMEEVREKILYPPIYMQMAFAAKVILENSLNQQGALLSLQEITTLAEWAAGSPDPASGSFDEDRVIIMAMLLHSYHARSIFANSLASKLATIVFRPPNFCDQAFDNPFIPNLTRLLLTSIEAKAVVESRTPVTDERVRAPFDSFYPTLLAEMRLDRQYMKVGTTAYMRLGDARLVASVEKGLFERRVFCSWGYMLACPVDSFGDMPCLSRLSRFGLVLHAIFEKSSQVIDGEERETILSSTLLQQASEDTE